MPDPLTTHAGLPPEAVFLNFRHLVDDMPTPYLVVDRALHIVYANKAYLGRMDQGLGTIAGRYLFEVFPETEERIAEVLPHFEAAFAGRTSRTSSLHYSQLLPDGTARPRVWQCVYSPYYDGAGQVAYVVAHIEDITEAERLRQKNEMIAKELDHRVKNVFAVVQATAALAGQRTSDAAEFRRDFNARIEAMSRTHDSLASSDWGRLQLRDIFAAELEQYGGLASPRISVSGPDIELMPKACQDGSLFIHELSTNAAKYGCFSQPGGRLDVSWEVSADGLLLRILWKESGLSGIRAPETVGFGTQLSDFMPTLTVTRTYREEGLAVEISVQLAALDVAA